MAFWNKKDETDNLEKVPIVMRVPHRYADILIETCDRNGYDVKIILADEITKTLDIQLPKGKLDKALDMLSSPLAKKLM